MIRTLTEVAAACGRGEKEKKGRNVVGALQFFCFFYRNGTATDNTLSHIERGEEKKHGVDFRKDPLRDKVCSIAAV